MDSRKEVVGSNIMQKARIEDRLILILHNEESGLSCFMLFYLTEGSRSYEREVGPRSNVLLCGTMC